MNGDNLVARLAKAEFFGGLDDKLDKVVSSLERGNLVANNTTGGIKLLNNRLGNTASKDRNRWAVFGHVSGYLTSVSEHYNQVDVEIENSRNCS